MGCIRNEILKNRKTSPADLAETNKKRLIAEGAKVSQRTLRKTNSWRPSRNLRDLCGLILLLFGRDYFGGRGSILPRMRTVSRITLPTIWKLLGLSLSIVSCGVWWKTPL
jgi:hypothetical protein